MGEETYDLKSQGVGKIQSSTADQLNAVHEELNSAVEAAWVDGKMTEGEHFLFGVLLRFWANLSRELLTRTSLLQRS
jgi:hypothetical protein